MKFLLSIFILLCAASCFCQSTKDANLKFENHKNSLAHPLARFTKVPIPASYDRTLGPPPMMYLVSGPDSVRAIFEGKVVAIEKAEDTYIVVTQYGDYLISYYNLGKPAFAQGSYVKRNQYMASLNAIFGRYYLIVRMHKGDVEVDPDDWIK